MCYGICTAETDDGLEDMDSLKREGLTDEEEEEEEDENQQQLEGPEEEEEEGEEEGEREDNEGEVGPDLEEKAPQEKKTD